MRAFNKKKRPKYAVKVKYFYDNKNGNAARLVFRIVWLRRPKPHDLYLVNKKYNVDRYLDDWNGVPYNKNGNRYKIYKAKENEIVKQAKKATKVDIRCV